MGFNCGFLGLPNVGKSTIFNALSAAGAQVESYPFCTTEAQIGTVSVPDEQLDGLAELFPDKEKVPTKIEFFDLAGLVEGAHSGEGLGNQFLAEVRGVDALVHVVRCFSNADVPLEGGELSPVDDIEVIETELLLKDLETVQKKLDGLERAFGREEEKTKEVCRHVAEGLSEGVQIREMDLSEHEEEELKDMAPLTAKPVLYVANVDEESPPRCAEKVSRYAEERGAESLTINGELEAELRELDLDHEEQLQYLKEWGLQESALDRLIQAGYRLLDLVTFYTTDGPEVRAWTVAEGTDAREAAGKIHTDFQQNFIQAEVVPVAEVLNLGSVKKARESGLARARGDEYEVEDGDLIHFVTGK